MSPIYTRNRIVEYFKGLGCTHFNTLPAQAGTVFLVVYTRYRFHRTVKFLEILENDRFREGYPGHSVMAAFDVQSREGWQMAQLLSLSQYPTGIFMALPRYVPTDLHPNYVPFCVFTLPDLHPKRLQATLTRILTRESRSSRAEGFNEGARVNAANISPQLAEEIDQLQTDLAVALSRREMEFRDTGHYPQNDRDLELTVQQLNEALDRAGQETITLEEILSGEAQNEGTPRRNTEMGPTATEIAGAISRSVSEGQPLSLEPRGATIEREPSVGERQEPSQQEAPLTPGRAFRLIDRTHPGHINVLVPREATVAEAARRVCEANGDDPDGVRFFIIGNTNLPLDSRGQEPLSDFMMGRTSIPVTLLQN